MVLRLERWEEQAEREVLPLLVEVVALGDLVVLAVPVALPDLEELAVLVEPKEVAVPRGHLLLYPATIAFIPSSLFSKAVTSHFHSLASESHITAPAPADPPSTNSLAVVGATVIQVALVEAAALTAWLEAT